MIKSELVQRIAERNGHLYQRDIENIVTAILDEIVKALSRGDRVELRGFGAFSRKARSARVGRNPRTGDAALRFEQTGISIERRITRADFESWIAQDVAAIEAALDLALADAGVGAEAIEAVFMTGGTSHVPAVRALFDRRFGAGCIHVGDAFRSVASGLALLALDRARASVAA